MTMEDRVNISDLRVDEKLMILIQRICCQDTIESLVRELENINKELSETEGKAS